MTPVNDGVTPCHWCFAEVATHAALAHAEWHRANNLRAAGCASLESLPDRVCDCGLAPVTGVGGIRTHEGNDQISPTVATVPFGHSGTTTVSPETIRL